MKKDLIDGGTSDEVELLKLDIPGEIEVKDKGQL